MQTETPMFPTITLLFCSAPTAQYQISQPFSCSYQSSQSDHLQYCVLII